VTAAELVTSLGQVSASQAVAAIAGLAAASGGHVGLLARHLESGEQLAWKPDDVIGTASAVKVAIASKTGSVGGCRVETGLLYLPGDGGTVAYCAAADHLADRSMTMLSEGNEILGRLGAIILARWWPGPGPVPVRQGWLPAPA